MPPLHPEKLTVAQLQRELKKHRVALPAVKAKKDVYVKLYRRHLMRENLGFSSDEEPSSRRSSGFTTSTAKMARRSQVYQTSNASYTPARRGAYKIIFQDKLSDVEDMTDRKLRTELQRRNVPVGPIVGTTRTVYERKLAELLSQEVQHGPTRTQSTMVSFRDDEESEGEEDEEEEQEEESEEEEEQEVEESDREESEEEVEEKFSDSDLEEEEEPVSGRGDTRPRRSTRLQALSLSRNESSSGRSTLSTSSYSRRPKKYRSKKPSRAWCGLPLWFWWLVILAGVVLFIYMIWVNMEGAGTQKIVDNNKPPVKGP